MVRKIKIKDFTDVVTGGTPSTRKREFWENGKIPWLNSGDLNQEIIYKASNYITQIGLKNSAAKLMPSDSVTIALTGATTGVVGYLTFEACANQSVTGILPSQNHFSKYLYYYLKSIRKKVINDSYGGAQPHISQGYVKEIIVPLPPLPEQKRIATILDKADALRQKNKQLLAVYDELLQATFLDMFGDPVVNPKGWEKIKLGQLMSGIDSGWSPKCDRLPRKNENFWAVLTLSSVSERMYLENYNKQLPEIYSPKESIEVKKGDVLFSRKNTKELVGACAYVFKTSSRLLMPDTIFRLKILTKCLNGIYVYFLLNSINFRKDVQKLATGSAGSMPNISKEKLKKLAIPLPPITLQNQFAQIVENIEAQKALLKKSMQESEDLFNGLVQKAFKGEL